jgi:cyclase
MLAKRVIPCLDVRGGRVTKGVKFKNNVDLGDPVEMAVKYSEGGADELVFYDITASAERRPIDIGMVEAVARAVRIPFAVGGGISSIDHAARLLDAGADKISLNSSAIADPSLITRIASQYGSQFVVVAIDARTIPAGSGNWRCTTHGGKVQTDHELFSWAHEAQERGAGEILFTSMDHDGTCKGYACEVYARLHEELKIPVIASGGAGNIADIVEVLTTGQADAALAASIFHYGQISIPDLKKALAEAGVNVRPIDI